MRRNGLFTPVNSFDWEAFDSPSQREGPTWQDVKEIVVELGTKADKKAIVAELRARGASQSAAYRYRETAKQKGLIRFDQQS
jgi:hypothetical protein